jgi:hypothetical protein
LKETYGNAVQLIDLQKENRKWNRSSPEIVVELEAVRMLFTRGVFAFHDHISFYQSSLIET